MVLSSFRGPGGQFHARFSHQTRLDYYMNYYMSGRQRGQCWPVRRRPRPFRFLSLMTAQLSRRATGPHGFSRSRLPKLVRGSTR